MNTSTEARYTRAYQKFISDIAEGLPLQVVDKKCLRALPKNSQLRAPLSDYLRRFCSLFSAARAALFCGSKAKACLKSWRASW